MVVMQTMGTMGSVQNVCHYPNNVKGVARFEAGADCMVIIAKNQHKRDSGNCAMK